MRTNLNRPGQLVRILLSNSEAALLGGRETDPTFPLPHSAIPRVVQTVSLYKPSSGGLMKASQATRSIGERGRLKNGSVVEPLQ